METITPYVFAGFSGAAIICGIILILQKKESQSLKVCGTIMLFFAIECGFAVLMISKGYRTNPGLIGLSRPLIFIYGPLFFLTFSIATGNTSKIKPDHFFHFIPFLAHSFLMIPFILKTPATKIFLYEHYVKGIAYIEYFPHFMMFMKVFFFSIYSIIPIILTHKYKKTVMEFYSTIDNSRIAKMYAISIVYILCSVFLAHSFFGYLTGPSFLRPDIPYSFIYPLAILVFLTAFFTLSGNEFFKCQLSTGNLIFEPDSQKNSEETIETSEKYQKNKIPQELALKAAILLKEIMEKQKPFTDSNLTLIDLAEMVHLKPYYLSQLINSRFGENFYVFINSARIKYSVELFKNPVHNEISILEIAYMSGFNSKSAFNTYFKNIMGETPSNYRKKIRLNEKT